MRLVLLFVAMLSLSGCAAKYDQIILSDPEEKFSPEGSVLIATPEDGFYETREYRNSGKMTALAVRSAFAEHVVETRIEEGCQSLDCLKRKYPAEFTYYVVPEILHWEDRATEWSGKPDRIEIQLTVYEQGSWNEIASTLIKGKSKWATLGGDHPQDLLHDPLDRYLKSLY
jgi:hypothetical protein